MDSSQNPFVRLKRYQVAGNNPEENHATEVLAACLDLSLEFRSAFLELLGEATSSPQDVEAWKIHTQVPIPAGTDQAGRSYWDLLLENQAIGRAVVVEVKVGAKLTQHQIDKYLSDLAGGGSKMHGTVFALLRDKHLAPPNCPNIITWKQVAALCHRIDPGSFSLVKSTDDRIAVRLVNYLETERIIMNYNPDDMLGLAAGVRAERAFDALTEECQRAAINQLKLGEAHFRQQRRTGSFPRLYYYSKVFYVDLHLRAAGLENWTAGHTLALGIGANEPCPQTRKLAAEFRAKGWQAWVHLVTRSWSPMKENEDIPQGLMESYVYKPLFGVGAPPNNHKAPEPWVQMPWETLVETVSRAFVEAISQIQDFEATLASE